MPLEFGSLTSDLTKRPFVSDIDPTRAGMFPIPIALISRTRVAKTPFSGLAQRLFHALLFIGWNVLEFSDGTSVMGCGSTSLRRLIGRGNQQSNSDLDAAFRLLSLTEWMVPLRADPTKKMITPLLSKYRYDQSSHTYLWRFADGIVDWCGRPGAAYAWLDIRVTRNLKSSASLRLYELGSVYIRREEKAIESLTNDFRAFLDAKHTYNDNIDFRSKCLVRALIKVNKYGSFTGKIEATGPTNTKVKNKLIYSAAAKEDHKNADLVQARPITRDDLNFFASVGC